MAKEIAKSLSMSTGAALILDSVQEVTMALAGANSWLVINAWKLWENGN
jgi:translation elongation factor EF-4